MRDLQTSIVGLGCIAAGVLLFMLGKHTPESLIPAGTCIMAGIGFLQAADSSNTVKRSELKDLGIVVRKLGREVEANEAEEKDQG
jgi:hypothetical protein